MMHVHISTHKLLQNCPYEYDPPVHKHVSPVYIYIYMTAVNVHWSNLRKTGVLKLLQDKNQLFMKTQTLVIVLTYSLTNPQKFLNTVFFLKTLVHILKEYIKMVFYRM